MPRRPSSTECARPAEGNPLYLEQLTAMLADQGLLADGRWLGSSDVAVEIPASLQALLASGSTASTPYRG